MVLFSASRRSLRLLILALCSAAISSLTSPASARSHHGARHSGRAHHYAERHRDYRRHRSEFARSAPVDGNPADGHFDYARAQRFANANDSIGPELSAAAGSAASPNVVAEARRYIGSGNPTGRNRLWCARFMNMVLQRSGYRGTGSDMARSFASYGRRVSGPQIGAIAVMSRRGGGHVGVVSGIDARGNPILVSGNYGNRVREATYPRSRIYAYVLPAG
jgi:uncharacterized protein (TIGR02594 family)